LLIGGGGEKVTLKLVAQYVDACNVGGGDVQTIRHKLDVIKMHCEQLGRDYQTIHRTTSTNCVIGDSAESALASLTEQQRSLVSTMQAISLIGTPDSMRKRIAEYEAAGVQELIIWLPDAAKFIRYDHLPENSYRISVQILHNNKEHTSWLHNNLQHSKNC